MNRHILNPPFFRGLAAVALLAGLVCRANAEPQAASNQQLIACLQVMGSVKRTLEAADHDYGGHRAAAVRDIGAAEHQVREALLGIPGAKTKGKGAPKVNVPEPQILSNFQLLESIPALQATVVGLNAANHDYGGHRTAAVRDLQAAISQLEKALEYISGRRRVAGGGGVGGGGGGGGAAVVGAGGASTVAVSRGPRRATTTSQRVTAIREIRPHHHKMHIVRKAESKIARTVKRHHDIKKIKNAVKNERHGKSAAAKGKHAGKHSVDKKISQAAKKLGKKQPAKKKK